MSEKFSLGAQLLRAWQLENEHTLYSASLVCGVPGELFRRWALGLGLPGVRYAAKIEDACKIPMRAWTQPAAKSKSKAA